MYAICHGRNVLLLVRSLQLGKSEKLWDGAPSFWHVILSSMTVQNYFFQSENIFFPSSLFSWTNLQLRLQPVGLQLSCCCFGLILAKYLTFQTTYLDKTWMYCRLMYVQLNSHLIPRWEECLQVFAPPLYLIDELRSLISKDLPHRVV